MAGPLSCAHANNLVAQYITQHNWHQHNTCTRIHTRTFVCACVFHVASISRPSPSSCDIAPMTFWPPGKEREKAWTISSHDACCTCHFCLSECDHDVAQNQCDFPTRSRSISLWAETLQDSRAACGGVTVERCEAVSGERSGVASICDGRIARYVEWSLCACGKAASSIFWPHMKIHHRNDQQEAFEHLQTSCMPCMVHSPRSFQSRLVDNSAARALSMRHDVMNTTEYASTSRTASITWWNRPSLLPPFLSGGSKVTGAIAREEGKGLEIEAIFHVHKCASWHCDSHTRQLIFSENYWLGACVVLCCPGASMVSSLQLCL